MPCELAPEFFLERAAIRGLREWIAAGECAQTIELVVAPRELGEERLGFRGVGSEKIACTRERAIAVGSRRCAGGFGEGLEYLLGQHPSGVLF
jgi:hypothetical protein